MAEDADLGRLIAAARAAYRAGDTDAGVRAAMQATAAHPDHGEAWWALGACQERAGRLGLADRAFRRGAAARVEPRDPPYRVPWARFVAAVDRLTGDVPPRLRAALDEVTLVLADYAEPDLLADHPDEWELLGLFTGLPRAERAGEAMTVSPTIHLFRRAHEHECPDRVSFDAELRRTLWHEFGHYLGYDEEGLGALDLD